MPDEQDLTSTPAPEGTPPGQSQPASVAPQPRPTEQAPKVNLQDIPEFKNWQRSVNDSIRAQKETYEQRIAQLEARQVALEDAGLDDFEKTQRANQRLQQQIQQMNWQRQQELQQQAEQQRIVEDMQSLVDEFGIPFSEVLKAQTYKDAMRMSKEWYAKNLTAQQQEEVDKRNAHLPDTGQGKAPGPSSRLEQELAKAETAVDYARILRRVGREQTRP